jgi:shikimate dehydrogenase
LSQAVDQYGVIGHPVGHSWSPFIHGMFARQTAQALAYRLYDVEPESFRSAVLDFQARGGRGLNVTVPHKMAAAELANELTERAQRAGAVNTLCFLSEHIVGDNTDGTGLVRDLADNLKVTITRRRILIVGAGGAARGVVGPLLALSPLELVIAGRTPERAMELAAHFAPLGTIRGCALEDLQLGAFDLVINATSAGLRGEVPMIPAEVIGPATLCYDMTYAKSETPFLRWGREQGCERGVLGWGMLVEQAAESFQLWRGVRPATAAVLAALEQRAGLRMRA